MAPSLRFASLLVLTAVTVAACEGNGGTYTPDPPGPPPPPTGIRAEDIGTACIFDPATGESPSLDCVRGTTCFISTPDNSFTPNGVRGDPLKLPAWEDPFTTDLGDGRIMGFCTVINQPDACPAGTRAKAFQSSSGIFTACIRTCSDDRNCPRASDVCDPRFFDDDGSDGFIGNEGSCVRKCEVDLPDCIRSGVIPGAPGQGRTVLLGTDSFGDAQCNQQTGRCEHGISKGTGTLGERCLSSSQCAQDSICLQGPLFDTPFGFCTSPAIFDQQSPTSSTCSVGTVPQTGLTFGPWTPELVVDVQSPIVQQVGYCFFQCQLDGAQICDQYEGTVCGGADPEAFQLPGPDPMPLSMCLPDSIRIE
jgi:hypothetical protein